MWCRILIVRQLWCLLLVTRRYFCRWKGQRHCWLNAYSIIYQFYWTAQKPSMLPRRSYQVLYLSLLFQGKCCQLHLLLYLKIRLWYQSLGILSRCSTSLELLTRLFFYLGRISSCLSLRCIQFLEYLCSEYSSSSWLFSLWLCKQILE